MEQKPELQEMPDKRTQNVSGSTFDRRSPVTRFLFTHVLEDYKTGWARFGYLFVAVLATVVLYYVYYVQTGVTPNLLAGYHMSFAFYIGIVVVSNLIGAFSALPASKTDRVGRANVVIYGLLIVGILSAIGVPMAKNEWAFGIIISAIGLVEGAVLVATPALVRDYSPQLGRASAMGFWTIGPVAGSLVTSLVALHTLDHFGQTHWQSQFVIAGIASLAACLISLFFLKDLSARLRDQLMVSTNDRILVEARARGLSDEEIHAATQHPWRQILKWDLVGSSFGIATFLLVYYAAASLFTIYYTVIFKNPNGTQFSVVQANGLNTWFWGIDILALIVVGILSDALKVRKPFMLVGAIGSMIMLVLFLEKASHPYTGYYTLALLASLLAICLSLVFAPWMASYTEDIEAKNPALVGTGLALWGWILRLVVGVSFLFLPLIVTSVNPVVDNLPIAEHVVAGQQIQNFVAEHSASVKFAEAHSQFLEVVSAHQTLIDNLAANESLANIAAVQKAIGPQNFSLLIKYETQLKTLVQPYSAQLNYLSSHQSQLNQLQKGVTQSPVQWQRWFWIDFAGMIVFLPLIWTTKGRWRPSSARKDAVEHDRRVALEMEKLSLIQ